MTTYTSNSDLEDLLFDVNEAHGYNSSLNCSTDPQLLIFNKGKVHRLM